MGKLHEATYSARSSPFCWTPTTNHIGEFRVYLSITDARGADNITSKPFFVQYNPDYISEPTLYLTEGSFGSNRYITLSWSTPFYGTVSYYEIHKSIDAGPFTHVATSTWGDNSELFWWAYMMGDVNSYQVRGCGANDKCGSWSNTISYNVGKPVEETIFEVPHLIP